MGLAIETLGFHVANPGATFTAVTMATSDSATVRQFNQGTKAMLTAVTRQGATAGAVRIRSATFHDPTFGITYVTAENPTHIEVPQQVGQPVQPGDTLTIEGTGGTAETEVGSLTIYYQDVLGLAAPLYNWADLVGSIEHLHTVEVDCPIGGTAGVWADTLINATQDTFKADRKYAILGYTTDTALAAIAFKGSETGNVRNGGPGTTEADVTSNWFIGVNQALQLPCIPVISANNKGSVNVGILSTATSGTAKVSATLALMAKGF